MQWSTEAEAAIKKVPFFVRKQVRAHVETETQTAGKSIVSLAQVRACQARYLSRMDSEIKGYQIDGCFGAGGCPNRALDGEQLQQRLETLLANADLLGFLRQTVHGPLKFHHEFRVTLADCPNACSQPQIKDVGIIGACSPRLTQIPCSACGACAEACREEAIVLDPETPAPGIDWRRCLNCGQCVRACPTGTLAEGRRGYRVLLGGKLGRHPRLARELPGLFDEAQVVEIVEACLALYKDRSRNGARFSEILCKQDVAALAPQDRPPQEG
ncbi:MAG: 4Fe-4S binding protein [Desulfobacterales bacterium]|nr:4Fe-4S binding protein [Desulfobacterales bacterium]